ncbi:MAG: PaaI family thioesterase [Deltaproteobacteria bacterium]|nr:PaaI family thioesterase [Deltaproteobacteria bacterium]PWB67337.1 MAG: thioesterase [Deltaproteobacteria bacterium]
MNGAKREYLPHSTGCFLCGDENACGVRLKFFVENDEVCSRITLPRHLNGYRDVAHGGVLAALLDESMGWAATVFGSTHRMYLTGELTVKYIAPVPVGEEIEVRSRMIEDAGRIAYSEGELLSGGRVCVRARGKFLPMSREATADVIPYLKFDRCGKYKTLFEGVGEAK